MHLEKNARNCSANEWRKKNNHNRFEILLQCDFSLKWCPISRAYFICVFIGKLPIILYGEYCIGTGLIWINGVNRKNKWRWKLVLSMHAEQQMSFVAWLTVLSDTFDLNPFGSWKCIAIHAIDMLPNCLCSGDATVHTFYSAHATICRNWKVRTILYINVTFMLRAHRKVPVPTSIEPKRNWQTVEMLVRGPQIHNDTPVRFQFIPRERKNNSHGENIRLITWFKISWINRKRKHSLDFIVYTQNESSQFRDQNWRIQCVKNEIGLKRKSYVNDKCK